MKTFEEQIEDITGEILLDYQSGRAIDHMELFRQPDKEIVIDMIGKLRRIIFPGYSREKNFRIYNVRHNLSMLIEDVMFNLTRQIALVLQGSGSELTQNEAELRAQQLSLDFFRQIPQIRALVQTDLDAAYDGDPAASCRDEIIFSYPGLFAITVYRTAHVLYELHVPMLPRMMSEYAHSITGIDIHPGASIGSYFFIDHGTGVVIGETAVIGSHVKLYQGVTLGALTTRGGQRLRGCRRHPTIEDHVTIYAGASILGGDTVIGRECVIGSNAFITSSVRPCTTVTIKNHELQMKPRPCACEDSSNESFAPAAAQPNTTE